MNDRLEKFRIRRHETLESTSTTAKQMAEAGTADDGMVIMALTQTGGRGRGGKTWRSEKGNLFFTVVCKGQYSREELKYFSFVTALAVRDALMAFFPDDADVALKWPNDVLVNGKKIAGILLESGIDGTQVKWMTVGVGINVASHPMDGTLLYPPTSIAAHKGAKVPPLDHLLSGFLAAFDERREQLRENGTAYICDEWRRHSIHKPSEDVRVFANGTSIEGTFQWVDDEGNMILRCLREKALRTVSVGDVFLLGNNSHALSR